MLAAHRSASTSHPALKLHQWKNHHHHVVRSCGITRDDGFTPHGPRHRYANQRYKAVSGAESPVRGGTAPDRETDRGRG